MLLKLLVTPSTVADMVLVPPLGEEVPLLLHEKKITQTLRHRNNTFFICTGLECLIERENKGYRCKNQQAALILPPVGITIWLSLGLQHHTAGGFNALGVYPPGFFGTQKSNYAANIIGHTHPAKGGLLGYHAL